MTTITDIVMPRYLFVRDFFRHQSSDQINLAEADISLILAVIFHIMRRGVNDASSIYTSLRDLGSDLDRDTVNFLLSAFMGTHATHHLWSMGPCGEYRPITGVFKPFI